MVQLIGEEAAAIMFDIADQEKAINLALMNERREGLEEGQKIGQKIGLTEGILGAVEIMLEDGKSDNEIVTRLMSKYSLTDEKAKEYLSRAQSQLSSLSTQ